MYRTILVPVQVPSEVEPLVRFASTLLETDGEIRVLHVIPTTTLPEVTREWRASVHMVVPAHEAGAALDVKVEPEVRASADVPGEILDSAESHDVDAILLTLRGDRRSRNPFVGHTASGVLHHARAAVLVLNRLALAADRIPRVLVPTFRADPPASRLQLAEDIALRHDGAPVVLMTLGARVPGEASPGGDGPSPRGVEIAHRRSVVPASRLGGRRHLPELILQAAAQERYGLLLVGEDPGRPGGPLLTRRFLEELFRAAPCPVVALRDPP